MDDNIKIIVFVDLDGTLADFDLKFKEISGLVSHDTPTSELWAKIDEYGTSRFFSELPWMSGGKELWNFINKNFLEIKILSSLGRDINGKTAKGKFQWLQRNIPELSSDDIIFVNNKHQKKRYSSPNHIMVDDNSIVITEWRQTGGIGILHKNSEETVNELIKYI